MKKLILIVFGISLSFSSMAIDGLLVKTIDKSFQEKWYKTISSDVPKLIDCTRVYKNQKFFLTTIAWDFEADEKNFAKVSYGIKILKPDGSVFFEQENLPLFNGKIVDKTFLQMSEAVLEINFEEEDSLGAYQIFIKISDEISSKNKEIKGTINLQELPVTDLFTVTKEEEFNQWFLKYYESPQPETALSYFLFYTQSSLSENDNSFLPIFSIFLEIFRNNPFLSSQIFENYPAQNFRTKTFLLYLIYYSDIGNEDFFNRLEGLEKEVFEQINGTSLPELYGEINDPAQLDMLWATFSANGSYQPILKLIQTLAYTKYQGALDQFKASEQTDEDRQKAVNNAIYDSLVWSFKSNCKQHVLVKNYATWALKNEELSAVQKKELKQILDSLTKN